MGMSSCGEEDDDAEQILLPVIYTRHVLSCAWKHFSPPRPYEGTLTLDTCSSSDMLNARLYLSANNLIPSEFYARGPWTRETTKLKPIRIIHYFHRLPSGAAMIHSIHVQHHSVVFVRLFCSFTNRRGRSEAQVRKIEKYSRIANIWSFGSRATHVSFVWISA